MKIERTADDLAVAAEMAKIPQHARCVRFSATYDPIEPPGTVYTVELGDGTVLTEKADEGAEIEVLQGLLAALEQA